MAIHNPGVKFRQSRLLSRKKGSRQVVALLSLTAMVDMFTVLVIFLLQNYNTEGLVVNIDKDVILPKAHITKELKPSIVVSISDQSVKINELTVIGTPQVRAQKDWMIQSLFVEAQNALQKAKEKLDQGMMKSVRDAIKSDKEPEDLNSWRKVTVQADKSIDILTLKKVMKTLTDAGALEFNFAVLKKEPDKK